MVARSLSLSLFVVALILLVGVDSVFAQFSFRTELNVSVPHAPKHLATGDFDGDGLQDVVASCFSVSTLSVAWGQPTRILGDPVTLSTGPSVQDVAAGDLDGDGYDDIVVASALHGEVWIHFSSGLRSFDEPTVIFTGFGPRQVEVADFDLDGDLDVVVLGAFGGAVVALLGSGDGTFEVLPPATTFEFPRRLGVGDFDGDGRLDLAVIDTLGAELHVLLGQPGFQFDAPIVTTLSDDMDDLVVGHFDSDSHIDVVAFCRNGCNSYLVQHGDGGGQFSAGETAELPADWEAVIAVDFDTDGHLDFAISRRQSNQLQLYRGSVGGEFDAQAPRLTGHGPTGIATIDVNHDGLLDFVTANTVADSLSQILRDPEGLFADNGSAFFESGFRTPYLSDFNGDGNVDVVARRSFISQDIVILLGDGSGQFAEQSVRATPSGGDLVLGDFDGDGVEDVIVIPHSLVSAFPASVHLIESDGVFATTTLEFPLPGTGHVGTAGDFDQDGTLDLIVATTNAADPGALGAYFYHGNGDGTFVAGVQILSDSNLKNVRSADFDADGFLDVAVLGCDSTATIHLGAGDGTFTPSSTLVGSGTGCNVAGLAVGDFDGNGYTDLAVRGDGSVSVLPSLGPSGYGLPTAVSAEWSFPIDPGDFDGDGRTDLVYSFQELRFLHGHETMTLESGSSVVKGISSSVGMADVDSDGDTDMVRGSRYGLEVIWNNLYEFPDCDFDGLPDADEIDADGDGIPDECQGLNTFMRGDCNADGFTDIADPIYVEQYLFLSGEPPSCVDACDTNDDGLLDIADAIFILTTLFTGGAAPQPPYGVCGNDPTDDGLLCDSYPAEACD